MQVSEYEVQLTALIQSGLRCEPDTVVVEVIDPDILHQAVELGRIWNQDALLQILRGWSWAGAYAELLEAVVAATGPAEQALRRFFCDGVEHVARLRPHPAAQRRFFAEHLEHARAIADARCPPDAPETLPKAPGLGGAEPEERELCWAAVELRLAEPEYARISAFIARNVDVDWLDFVFFQTVEALLTGHHHDPVLVRLSRFVWQAVSLDARGAVQDVVEPDTLHQAFVLGRLVDDQLLARALRLFQWQTAYPLFLAAADGDAAIAARESRLFACDCVERLEPNAPGLSAARQMALDNQRRPQGGGLARWLTDRSASRAARKTLRTIQQHLADRPEAWQATRAWQQARLIDRVVAIW